MRKIQFQNKYYYHIYNRGVDKREVFMDEGDYLRFLRGMREFNRPDPIESLRRLDQIRRRERKAPRALSGAAPDSALGANPVEIIAYCLNPNHYHLLLKQVVDKGISKFMQKLGQGYTSYFNLKNNRTGQLVSSPFKSKEIKSDAQLLYVSAYINGNPQIHKIAKADKWIYSSYLDYLGKRQGKLANKDIILKEFENIQGYQEYVNEVIKNSSEIKEELRNLQIE